MACHFRILPDDFLISVRFVGCVTLKDILTLIDSVDADTNFKDGMLEFNDMSALKNLRIKPKEILGISDLTRSLYRRGSPPKRSAYWAPNRFFKSASLYCSVFSRVKGIEVETFRERAAALEFLGVSTASLGH